MKNRRYKHRKDLITAWIKEIRQRPQKQAVEIQAQIKQTDEVAVQKGLPTSVQKKAEQYLVFVLTQIGAFKRLEEDRHERNS